MANQMIALGVRGPQITSPGALAQQYGNVMANMATARQRQNETDLKSQFRQLIGNPNFDPNNPAHIQAAQALDPAGAAAIARAYTDRRAADLVQERDSMILGRQLSLTVNDEPSYQRWLGQLHDINPRWAGMIQEASPTYNPAYMTQLRMDVQDWINKTIPTPTATVGVDANGNLRENRVGGTGPSGSYEIREYNIVPATAGGNTAPANDEPSTPVSATPAAAAAPTAVTPQDLIDQGVPANNIPFGNPMTPPSAAPGLTPASAGGMAEPVQFSMETAPQIIQNAVQNRVIDQTHFQQLRDMVGPENAPKLASWMQQNQIRIQPAGEAPMAPPLRSAEYRPDQGAPAQFQQVQVAPPGTVYAPTGRAATGRNPSVGQYPGSDLVPIERSAAREGAEEGAAVSARRRIEVATEEPLVAGRERAQRLERLREAAPGRRRDAQMVVTNLTDRIRTIDNMLRTRDYESIVGSIEGRIPTWLQDEQRSGAQANWDFVVSNSVLDKLVADRGQTATGASPQGIVSDRDAQTAAAAANRLRQTTSESAARAELLRLRNHLYEIRNNTVRSFNETHREIAREQPDLRLSVPTVSPTYAAPAVRRPATSRPEARTSSGTPVRRVWGRRSQ